MKKLVALFRNQMSEILRKAIRFFLPTFDRVFVDEFQKYQIKKRLHENEKFLKVLQSCGAGVLLHGRVFISSPKSVCIGNNVHIGEHSFLRTEGGLTIGDNTHISRNVSIYTVNHNYEGDALPYDNFDISKPVAIGKNVWIGRGVSIIPGIRIGDGAIIGMGTVVTRNIPAHAIAGSPPAQVWKYRDKEHYEKLDSAEIYSGVNGKPIPKDIIKQIKTKVKDHNRTFFVVTTGRSGSTAFADLLTQHPLVSCLHEPRSQLIRLSTEIEHGTKQLDQARNELFDIYGNSSVTSSHVHGECDHKLFNLIPLIYDLIPQSKFIWLIRDGRDVVSSTWGRGWYRHEKLSASKDAGINWSYYRLDGSKCGFFTENEWGSLSTFEKNCWYWYYVNLKIKSSLESIPEKKWLMVKLEELNSKTEEIFKFLGVDSLPVNISTLNHGRYKIKKWKDWSEDERMTFSRWCGGMMDEIYPLWHANFK